MNVQRIIKWILLTVATVTVALVAGFLWLFSLMPEPSRDEVVRVSSPDGAVDAVLVEVNGGATTSFSYEVYVVKRGQPPIGKRVAYLNGAVRNQSAYGVNLRWESNNLVAAEYLSAKSMEKGQEQIRIGSATVVLVLRSSVLDPAAPPGGMQYNIDKGTSNSALHRVPLRGPRRELGRWTE